MDTLTVLDTNVFIEHFRGLAAATAYIQGLRLHDYGLVHGLEIPDALIAAIVLDGDHTLVTSKLRHCRFIAGLHLEQTPYRLPQSESAP